MSALLRLMWRPGWLLVGLLAILPFISLLVVLAAIDGLDGLAAAVVGPPVWWIVAATLGFGVTAAQLQLLHAPFSWGLPDLRRQLRAGTLVVGLTVSVPPALVPGLPPAGALTAFALTLFVFVLCGAAAEVGGRSTLGLLALLFVFGFGLRPGLELMAEIAARWPLEVGTIALVGSGLLLASQFSARTARARYDHWSLFRGRVDATYWKGRRGRARRWTGSLATSRLVPWLRAASWEGSWGSGGQGLWLHFLGGGVAFGLMAHAMNNPFTVYVVGFMFAFTAFELRAALPHPISRPLRARVVAWGGTLQLVLIGGAMAATIVGAGALGVPVFRDEPLNGLAMGPALAMALALGPLAQWPSIQWGHHQAGGPDPRGLARIAVAVGYGAVAWLATVAVSVAEPLVGAVVIAGTALLAQVLFHLAVRRHYARADLIVKG